MLCLLTNLQKGPFPWFMFGCYRDPAAQTGRWSSPLTISEVFLSYPQRPNCKRWCANKLCVCLKKKIKHLAQAFSHTSLKWWLIISKSKGKHFFFFYSPYKHEYKEKLIVLFGTINDWFQQSAAFCLNNFTDYRAFEIKVIFEHGAVPPWPEGRDVCVHIFCWVDGLESWHVRARGILKSILPRPSIFQKLKMRSYRKGGNVPKVTQVICGLSEPLPLTFATSPSLPLEQAIQNSRVRGEERT